MPADTSGFSFFPGDAGFKLRQYPGFYTTRALPTMRSATPGDQPLVLFWNDFADRGAEQEWLHALYSCGYTEGNNLDIYYTNGPSSGVGNGLGGRATTAQLAGYNAMLYSSGDLASYTITGVDYANDGGDDVGVIDGWLKLGNKGLFMTGDEIVYNLNATTGPAGPAQLAFEDTWIQVNLVARSVRSLIGNQTAPTVGRLAGGPFNFATKWIADGGCPGINQFNAITVQGSAVRVAEFLSPTCGTGAYPYAAAVQTVNPTYNAKVILLPYDLMNVVTDTDCGGSPASPYPVRAQLLRDVLLAFSNPVSSPTTDVPAPKVFAASMSPNPFNPVTKVAYTMPERGRLTVEVYDLRGRLVTTLHDGVVEAGSRDIEWKADSSVSSGVYFVQVRSDFGSKTIKAALVK
ncbi:MAG: T9SS type A sorting domain-containing protein, partial [Candidatus Krumholzibacteriia bacterium]